MMTKRVYVTLDVETLKKLDQIREVLAENNIGRITNSDVVKFLVASYEEEELKKISSKNQFFVIL